MDEGERDEEKEGQREGGTKRGDGEREGGRDREREGWREGGREGGDKEREGGRGREGEGEGGREGVKVESW